VFDAPHHPTLAPFNGSFDLAEHPTLLVGLPSEERLEERLDEVTQRLAALQQQLYADHRWALLVVFQGRDAAGKDGTIARVFQRADPAGVHVTAFRAPSEDELDHDFLWRTVPHLPARGHIGVFNRSYYEEVLVARVHPELLLAQHLPDGPDHTEGVPEPPGEFWLRRFESIRNYELHLARSGVAVVKFFLNVSADEQRDRFLARLKDPAKHWKFREEDIRDRERWHDYTAAYQAAIENTSRAWAPWYVIPADDKDHMRVMVAERIIAALEALDLRPPEPAFDRPIEEIRELLEDARPPGRPV